jgi:hypothetical protein
LDDRLHFPGGSPKVVEPNPEVVVMRTRPHFLRTLAVGGVLLLGFQEARAQTPDSVEIRDVLRRAQNRNWYVRLQHDDDTVQGKLRLVRDTAAIIGKTLVPLRHVESLERRTFQGSSVGGLLVGALGFMYGGALCELAEGCAVGTLITSGIGFGLGSALGTILGLIADPGTLVWISVWPQK